jgi:C1A family cysteine protease
MKKLLHSFALSLLVCGSVMAQDFVRVNSQHISKQVSLHASQALQVDLPSKPSSGFGWYLKNTSDVKRMQQGLLKQAGNYEFVTDNPTAPVGAPGTQTIKFVPQGAGVTTLELLYKRPWEDNSKAADSYTITVNTEGMYTGPEIVTAPIQAGQNHSRSIASTLPATFSWLAQGKCTTVKDQGQCGSCWSFASCGSLECDVKIWDNNVRSFSEQWLINCDQACSACNGGWCPDSMFTIFGGVYEADLPYASSSGTSTGTCASSYTYHEKPVGYHQIANNPTDAQIKQAIYDYGPVWAGVDAGNNFQAYTNGIMTASDGTSIDHAIVLVGWDDTNNCWILRNSWGTSWGENGGYMRIGYGVSGVGTNATYFMYKTGIINHNLPPVADFSVNTPTSCGGVVHFTDNSANSPTSWAWNFGDSQTSTAQNPAHTYMSSGTYTVTLTATNSYGNNSVVKNNIVTVSIMNAPVTTGATRVGPGVVNLSATVSSGASSIDWYTTPTGGTSVNTGTTYSPTISATTTYYVTNETTSPVQGVGPATNAGTGAYYTANTDRRIFFNVIAPVTINTVDVYANSAGARQIVVLNSAGTVIDSASFTAVTGLNTVTLNFTLAPDTGYAMKMGVSSPVNLFRNSAGVTYPYTISGLVSITTSDATPTASSYYYYFYNWKVQTPTCSSTRTSVIGTVNTATGIANVDPNTSFRYYPNPTNGELTVEGLTGDENQIEVFDVIGKLVSQTVTTNPSCVLDLRNQSKGMYMMRVTNKSTKAITLGKVIVN